MLILNQDFSHEKCTILNGIHMQMSYYLFIYLRKAPKNFLVPSLNISVII